MRKFLDSEGFKTRLIVSLFMVAVIVPSYFLFNGIILRILLGIGLLVALFEVCDIVVESRFFPNRGDVSLAGFLGLSIIVAALSLTGIETNRLGALVTTCAATDVGAYMVGKAIGKTHLPRSISPNKTYEGTIGGLAIGMIVAVVWTRDGTLVWVPFVAFLGDLLESVFKRRYGVKDSNDFLLESDNALVRSVESLLGGRNGHGGYFDRLDSLTLALFINIITLTTHH